MLLHVLQSHSFLKQLLLYLFLLFFYQNYAQVVLEREVKVTDLGLHFNGVKIGSTVLDNGNNNTYDYYFGRNISAHGDCIKTYGTYVFMTWYRGGKDDRHVMLTRYNTETGTMATIEFPHQHTGYQNKYWIGESHNTIGIGVSPKDGTIHLLYDMHAYSASRPSDGSLSNDYFRYSYSVQDAASVSDSEFTLDKFVQSQTGGYKHLRLTGSENQQEFVALTYPKFFLNDAGDLFMNMREGGNNNGAYKFSKYDANTSTWSNFIDFNVLGARSRPDITYNWGLYGSMKYLNGKLRIGFQRRSQNNEDKYLYQNGVYYAYSDDQSGASDWKNHEGATFAVPLYDADFIKVMEPGDYVSTTQVGKVYIVGDFDWTVTEKGDVHIISKVKDNQYNVTKYLHTYKPAGATEFITSEDFSGATSIYTSGDDIFIIGLKNGRVFVEKAAGGTNNFTRVYQATTGKTFDHGRVHIANGKLYYYLMENASGNAQPLYLQVIDLDIIQAPFRITLTSPFEGKTYDVGETITLSANAIDENGSIDKVAFMIDDNIIHEDFTPPYSVDWSTNVVGTYSLKAVAYNTSDEMVATQNMILEVQVYDPTDLTGDVYRIKNLVTGKYLHSVGSDVVESSNGVNVAEGDKEWAFVRVGAYYNIESKRSDRGILRAAGNPPNDIISTGFSAPTDVSDKLFTVVYNINEGSYQFKTKTGSNYIYQNEDGVIEHLLRADDRSKWLIESTSLSTQSVKENAIQVKISPNPTKNNFTISRNKETSAKIQIYDMLGQMIYDRATLEPMVNIENNGRFKPGLYLIRIIDEDQRVFHSKLIVE